jgi:hypothetical protein
MDAWARLFRDEEEALLFLIGEEFSMSDNFFLQHNKAVMRYILEHEQHTEAQPDKAYAPNGSNYHDHLCNCPGCNYDGPDPTDAEIAAMQEPEVVLVLDPIEHTQGRPFCSDPHCPCREDQENIHLLYDLMEQGLLTPDEASLIMRDATI